MCLFLEYRARRCFDHLRFKEQGTEGRRTGERLRNRFRSPVPGKPIHPIPGWRANTTSFSGSCSGTVEARILLNATCSPFSSGNSLVYHYCRGFGRKPRTEYRCEAEAKRSLSVCSFLFFPSLPSLSSFSVSLSFFLFEINEISAIVEPLASSLLPPETSKEFIYNTFPLRRTETVLRDWMDELLETPSYT